jgi:CheY-like chemotaxis protein
VARQLRERPLTRDVLLIAVSGYGQEEDRRRSREAGFNHHLIKPIDFSDLQQVMPSLRGRLNGSSGELPTADTALAPNAATPE